MNRRTFIATTAAAILGRDRIAAAALPRLARPVQIEIRYTSNDVEYIEYRQFQVEEIARLFRIPQRMIL